jgi:hypothetical protein
MINAVLARQSGGNNNERKTMTTATKTYEGTKRVNARPMNRCEYNAYRGWEVHPDENPADDGYLVEYLDGGKPNHPGHAGYISWSPKDVFERAYCEVGQGMSFGDALNALKTGKRVARFSDRYAGRGLGGAGMTTHDQTIEDEIQAKGLTAPRVTPADIEANIASEHYFTAEDGVGRWSKGQTSNGGKNPVALSLLTFCVLVLKNGFTVTGESACASPENFDAELGRNIARQNAVQKIWPLMGYELRSKLAHGAT